MAKRNGGKRRHHSRRTPYAKDDEKLSAAERAAQRRTKMGCALAALLMLLVPCLLAFSTTLNDDRLYIEYLRPGYAYYNAGDYPHAESDFRNYLRSGTDNGIHYYLGMCLYNEGKSQEALQEFRQDVYSWRQGRGGIGWSIRQRSNDMIDKINGKPGY